MTSLKPVAVQVWTSSECEVQSRGTRWPGRTESSSVGRARDAHDALALGALWQRHSHRVQKLRAKKRNRLASRQPVRESRQFLNDAEELPDQDSNLDKQNQNLLC